MAFLVEDATVQIERLEMAPYGTNAYIVICRKTRDSLVVDAPAGADAIVARLRGTHPRYILLTHNHMDHVGALAELRATLKVPLVAHAADAGGLSAPPEMPVTDGDTILLGNLRLGVLHTPGHTPGSLCFKVGRYLLSGDTIFPGGPGATRSPDDFRQIVRSITEKIFVLPGDTPLYPGHGESSVLQKEKAEFAVFAARPTKPDLCGQVVWLSS